MPDSGTSGDTLGKRECNMSGDRKKRGLGPVSIVVLIIACGVLGFSIYKLAGCGIGYLKGQKEYSNLADTYTSKPPQSRKEEAPDESASAPELTPTPAPGTSVAEKPPYPDIEDADPPLTVNWEELKNINEDIAGWLYVDGEPSINYPICQEADNDYYLHRTFEKQDLFSGAIFVDYHNAGDFTDPNTIVYGHNMRDGSMFGKLKYLAEKYEEHPYFWILTPQGDYRYHIYSIMSTPKDSEVYMLYSGNGDEFLKWEQLMQSRSEVKNTVPLFESDYAVVLSTCTSDSDYRKVVIGKCVSSKRPVRRIVTPTPVLPDAAEYLDDDAAYGYDEYYE